MNIQFWEDYHSKGATVHTRVRRIYISSAHPLSRVLAGYLLPCLWRGHRREGLDREALR